jgi:hypothetical protein
VSQRAGASEVLVTNAVQELVAGAEFSFTNRGSQELRGVPGEWTLFALESERLAAVAALERPKLERRAPPLPLLVAAKLAESKLVDRVEHLRRLENALARMRDGELRTVLIGGEPGIGKTRLAAEIAGRAHGADATVLSGRCDPELEVPYQPFVELLAQYVRCAPAEALERHRAQYGLELTRLVPELNRAGGSVELAAGPAREENRHVMFAAVHGLLGAAAAGAPLVLVLDDLHWADKPTLLLLRYLLLAPEPIGALVIGTYRSTELGLSPALAELLDDLQRNTAVDMLSLAGLSAGDVVTLAQQVATERLDAGGIRLVHALGEEANGNPFFLGEMLRSLEAAGGIAQAVRRSAAGGTATLELPGSVRAMIVGRVTSLGEEAKQTLSAASVIGREFSLELLAEVLDQDPDALLDVLDRATDAALIAEQPDVGMRFAFAHQMIVSALYEQLGAGRRRRMHRLVLEGLERSLPDGARAEDMVQLAYHAVRGIPLVDARKAVEYARLAGVQALEQLAPQAAMRWFKLALECYHHSSGAEAQTDDPLLLDLLIGRGIAQQQGGDPEFRATLLEASSLAREIGDTERLAQAALANTRGFASETGTIDHERVELLEAALSAIGDQDSPRRAMLLATLSAELTFAGDWQRRKALSDESLAIAQRLGDPPTVSAVLSTRFITIWTPETLGARLDETRAGLAIAEELDNPLLRFRALHWRAAAAVETGQLDLSETLVEQESELAERLQQPTSRWLAAYDRATQALMRGLLAEAERSAEDAYQIANESREPEALAFYVGQLINIRFEQGRLGELEPMIAQQAAANPGIPAFRAALALARCEAGLMTEAAAVLAVDAENGFAEFPYDSNWLVGIAIYAEACAQLSDARAGEALHRCLEPWADHVAFNSATSWGLVLRHLGNLDRAAGRYDDGERELEQAARRHERMGAPIWLARTRVDLAQTVIDRDGGRGQAGARAHALLERALATASDLGAAGIGARASRLMAQLEAGRSRS